MKNLDASSVKSMIGFVKRTLETAYREDQMGNPPAGKVKTEGEKSLRAKAGKKTRDAKEEYSR